MEKLIDDTNLSNIWQAVRAILASALQRLRGESAAKYLHGALKMLRQAENKVREQLALMAMRMELAPSMPAPDTKSREKRKPE